MVTSSFAAPGLSAQAANTAAPEMRVVGNFPHGYFEYTASSGAVIQAAAVVDNAGGSQATYLVSGVDGFTSPASGVVFGNRQIPFRDGPLGNGEFGAGTWITLDRSQVTLNPGQSATVNATVSVPPGVHAGDWVGGIIAENPTAAAPGQGSGSTIAIKEATAIAVVVHVPGTASPGSIFLGQPTIRVVSTADFLDIPLRYTGDVLVKPVFSFKIADATGHVVYQHSGRFDTFVPHTTIVYEIRLPVVLGPGDYTFTGTAGPDGHPQTFTYPIHLGQAPSTGPPHQTTPGTIPFTGWWPGGPAWAQLLVVVLPALLLILLLILAWRRRCTHCGRPRPWGLMPVSDYQEISHCPECRAVARERRRVSLCPACYRSHVLPVAQEAATAR